MVAQSESATVDRSVLLMERSKGPKRVGSTAMFGAVSRGAQWVRAEVATLAPSMAERMVSYSVPRRVAPSVRR
jgi:hypothetical protein